MSYSLGVATNLRLREWKVVGPADRFLALSRGRLPKAA